MADLKKMLNKLSMRDQEALLTNPPAELAELMPDVVAHLMREGKRDSIRARAAISDHLREDDAFAYTQALADQPGQFHFNGHVLSRVCSAAAGRNAVRFTNMVVDLMGRNADAALNLLYNGAGGLREDERNRAYDAAYGACPQDKAADFMRYAGSAAPTERIIRDALGRNDVNALRAAMQHGDFRGHAAQPGAANIVTDPALLAALSSHADVEVRHRFANTAIPQMLCALYTRDGAAPDRTAVDAVFVFVNAMVADHNVEVKNAAMLALVGQYCGDYSAAVLDCIKETVLNAAKKRELAPYMGGLLIRGGRCEFDADAAALMLADREPLVGDWLFGPRGNQSGFQHGIRVCDALAVLANSYGELHRCRTAVLDAIVPGMDATMARVFVDGMDRFDFTSPRRLDTFSMLAGHADPEVRTVAASGLVPARVVHNQKLMRAFVWGTPGHRHRRRRQMGAAADFYAGRILPEGLLGLVQRFDADPDRRVREAVAPAAAAIRGLAGQAPAVADMRVAAPVKRKTAMERLKEQADALKAQRAAGNANLREM